MSALPGDKDKTYSQLLEIGPGMGVLTKILYPLYKERLFLVEIDNDLIPNLKKSYPLIENQIFQEDFLALKLEDIFKEPFGIIGNFPYNISSQILFKLVDYRHLIPELTGMFQKEVAERIVSPPGNKVYGLLSAWVQAFYKAEYLFTVNEGSFNPPPKVKSGVIRLVRKENIDTGCNEELLLNIIKQGFNQRRKTLRNSLSLWKPHFDKIDSAILDKRAEQLSSDDFVGLAKAFSRKL